ncbi:hypothetical protein M073_0996 [Bacteroides fragilis str. DS-71]|nr:hypothetical protein M073_0996 [Bacteroides fragilis str. DS-71]
MPYHYGHVCFCHTLGREDQVSFIFSVFVIYQKNPSSFANGGNGALNSLAMITKLG